MSQNLAIALTYLAYAILFIAALVGSKYWGLSPEVTGAIIGSILTHFGIVGGTQTIKAYTNTTSTDTQKPDV